MSLSQGSYTNVSEIVTSPMSSRRGSEKRRESRLASRRTEGIGTMSKGCHVPAPPPRSRKGVVDIQESITSLKGDNNSKISKGKGCPGEVMGAPTCFVPRTARTRLILINSLSLERQSSLSNNP